MTWELVLIVIAALNVCLAWALVRLINRFKATLLAAAQNVGGDS